MSTIEKIDDSIAKMINNLVAEHGKTGWSGPSPERKNQIIEEIATLRA